MLAHPLSRGRVAAEKLAAVMIGVLTFNICVYVVAIVSTILCGEKVPFKEITLLHFAYLLMQLEIAGICFGISAFMRRGTAGVGLGAAILMYFFTAKPKYIAALHCIKPDECAKINPIHTKCFRKSPHGGKHLAHPLHPVCAGQYKYCRALWGEGYLQRAAGTKFSLQWADGGVAHCT